MHTMLCYCVMCGLVLLMELQLLDLTVPWLSSARGSITVTTDSLQCIPCPWLLLINAPSSCSCVMSSYTVQSAKDQQFMPSSHILSPLQAANTTPLDTDPKHSVMEDSG